MALIVKTDKPSELLDSIKKAIDAKKIETWVYDHAGDLTHSPDQWKDKGWMRPKVEAKELRFIFLGNSNIVTTRTIYAVFHGRLAEMLLSHFDTKFSSVNATAMPEGDMITSRKDIA
jgi:hypothetical protein